MKVTVLQRRGRISTPDFTATLQRSLSNLKGDLYVTAKFIEFSPHGWAVVDVEGADREVFLELLAQKLGLAHSNFLELKPYANYPGQIISFNRDLEVDIGVESPDPINVTVKLGSLRAQLAYGKPIGTKEIQDAYCLFPGSKADVRITSMNQNEPILAAWLSDSQIKLFADWISTDLDRVQILNCTHEQLDYAIHKTNLERDIISAESMTLTTHFVTCKLGTDGVGLIPKLGPFLRQSELKTFLPKRIRTISGSW